MIQLGKIIKLHKERFKKRKLSIEQLPFCIHKKLKRNKSNEQNIHFKWKNAKTYGNFGRGVVRKEGKYVPSIRFGKRMNRVAQEKADEGEEEVE